MQPESPNNKAINELESLLEKMSYMRVGLYNIVEYKSELCDYIERRIQELRS